MENSREKWSIFNHPSKPTISAAEVNYWKDILTKTLKVGIEFEFNLEESKGNCKGTSKHCGCVYMLTRDCWKQCVLEADCRFASCENITATCEAEECIECSHYKNTAFKCTKESCSRFIPKCIGCADYTIDCTNCENKFDPTKNPKKSRDTIINTLKPSESYGVVEGAGIHSITTDGSLLGEKGVEIITVGRRINYWEFYDMAKKIIDISLENGAYTNERTSIHMHVLAGYFSKLVPGGEEVGVPSNIRELERDVPEIILANYHQLCRKYQNAMTWMFMGLNEKNRLTRWEKFRVSILDVSPIMNSMIDVKDAVKRQSGGNKYGFINYNYCEFNNAGDVRRFHVEARGMDNIPCPSIVAAIACLQFALVIKSVEISRYGILNVGDDGWLAHAKEIKECILNNMKDYQAGDRFADTSNLERYYNELRDEAMDMLYQMKHILMKVGPSFEVLEQIAIKPAAFRRVEGKSWKDIEEEVVIQQTPDDELNRVLDEYIDLRYISKCNDIKHWVISVSESIERDPNLKHMNSNLRAKIATYINYLRDCGHVLWSNKLGSVVKI